MTRRPSILRVADVPDNRTGGMARFMHFGADELAAAGWGVDFIFQDDLGVSARGPARRFLVPLRVVQLVRRRLRAGARYDAVEVHEPSAAAYAAARRLDPSLPPLVVISHGVESRGLRAVHGYLRRKGVRLGLRERWGYRLTALWQSDFALRNADRVVLSTTEDRDYLVRRLRVRPDRVTIVNGGVTRPFLDCPTGSSPGAGVIFLASWVDRKGVRDAVPVLARVARECPGTPVTVAGCGKPAEAVLADFPADVRPAVRVVPGVRGDDALVAEYRAHAVYFAPSVFEGQLLTMLEAAAAGLAPVCTATCGMKDFVRDGENGLLAGVGDTAGLGGAVVRLVRDPGLAARLGARAQEDARRYTWRRSADQLLAACRAAARGGGR